jgi:4-diphosphocytidyl-2-C-methyl-D-erythritol kinase
MTVFPNAKINLGLSILSRREDGFHNIESIFLPIPWVDELSVYESDTFSFECDGIPIDGNTESNLCVKAYALLQEDFKLPPVQIKLQKNIPIGAGLGGGSADAAFTLKALNDLFHLTLKEEELEAYADRLGSDCSFFIANKPAFVSGKGEKIDHSFHLAISAYCMVVYPQLHISTKEAYENIEPKYPEVPLRNAIKNPLSAWQGAVVNDFEAALISKYPTLQQLRKNLKDMGASYVSMSGSGSSFFAFFSSKPTTILFSRQYAWKGFFLE